MKLQLCGIFFIQIFICFSEIAAKYKHLTEKRQVELINAPPPSSGHEGTKKSRSEILKSFIRARGIGGYGSKLELRSWGRSGGLTGAEKTEALTAHNSYRANQYPQAADEMKMSWDENLARLAEAWAQRCTWEHGMINDDEGNRVGQNMYMMYGGPGGYPDIDVSTAIGRWVQERENWDFVNERCQDNRVCGHWTQVVWSRSTRVGCGYARCPVIGNVNYANNGLIFVCNYSPAGNFIGQRVYEAGPACSSCWKITRNETTNRGYKCENNLCEQCSPATDANCQCGPVARCENGGRWLSDTCECRCAQNFYGPSCQHECRNHATGCQYWYEQGFCSQSSVYHYFMKENCPAICNLCV